MGKHRIRKLRYQSDGERFDGTRNGEQLPPDTYYYVLKFDEYVFKSALYHCSRKIIHHPSNEENENSKIIILICIGLNSGTQPNSFLICLS